MRHLGSWSAHKKNHRVWTTFPAITRRDQNIIFPNCSLRFTLEFWKLSCYCSTACISSIPCHSPADKKCVTSAKSREVTEEERDEYIYNYLVLYTSLTSSLTPFLGVCHIKHFYTGSCDASTDTLPLLYPPPIGKLYFCRKWVVL